MRECLKQSTELKNRVVSDNALVWLFDTIFFKVGAKIMPGSSSNRRKQTHLCLSTHSVAELVHDPAQANWSQCLLVTTHMIAASITWTVTLL